MDILQIICAVLLFAVLILIVTVLILLVFITKKLSNIFNLKVFCLIIKLCYLYFLF